MDKKSVSDGMGGFGYEYTEGATFKGLISTVNTMERVLAEQQGATGVYRLTIDSSVAIEYNDVVKRKSDGQHFRMTTFPDDVKAPSLAGVQIKQCICERFTIPQ